MKVIIQPSSLTGNIQAPASKSSMQRACAAALLFKGTTIIDNPGHSNDDKAALDIIQKLGAKTVEEGGRLKVESKGVDPVSSEINCGESGLGIRMFTPLAALADKEIVINGTGSLVTRPMDFFDSILPQLGVKIRSNEGKLPLVIKGPLRPADIEVDGSLSSQFLTGLLLAYSISPASSPGTVTIKVNDLKSKPYIDLTLEIIKKFGFTVPVNNDYREFIFNYHSTNANTSPAELSYTVEGDWSGAAFLLVAGAIAGPITVRGLSPASAQADKAILDALIACNAGIAVDAKQIIVHPADMKGFDFDATDCPDLFPPLAVLAAYCEGETRIKGVSRLTHKESNRAQTLQEELGKMGIKIELDDDRMLISGNKKVKAAIVHSRHDHRIAMACAIASLKADGETVIEEAQAVKKSYPDFYSDLRSLNASLSLPFQIA